MKEIILIRHAKSSWDNANLADHDRPLTEKGIHDGKLMAHVLHEKHLEPSLVLASDAIRSTHTLRLLFGRATCPTEIHSSLYLASKEHIESKIAILDNDLNRVAIVAHNPGLTDCILATGYEFEHLLSTGIALIQWDTDSWAECTFEQGKTALVLSPKEFK